MMAMTTNSSISVKPAATLERKREGDFIVDMSFGCRSGFAARHSAILSRASNVHPKTSGTSLKHIVCHNCLITHKLLCEIHPLRQLPQTVGAELLLHDASATESSRCVQK